MKQEINYLFYLYIARGFSLGFYKTIFFRHFRKHEYKMLFMIIKKTNYIRCHPGIVARLIYSCGGQGGTTINARDIPKKQGGNDS